MASLELVRRTQWRPLQPGWEVASALSTRHFMIVSRSCAAFASHEDSSEVERLSATLAGKVCCIPGHVVTC